MFNALTKSTYVGGGDISITRIINPPRITTLRKFHEDEITEDAADLIWSLLGQAVHVINERSADNDVVVETRLQIPIQGIDTDEGPLKWILTGQPDVYEKKIFHITDYKITSVWSVIFASHNEWDAQINLQAMLHRHKGDKVLSGSIVAIMRDWQVRKAKYEGNYPPLAVKPISYPLWPQAQALDYAQKRVKLHQQAQIDYLASGKDPDVLPLCTPEERWYRGGQFAVKRFQRNGKINKKADKCFDTEEAAQKYITGMQSGTWFDSKSRKIPAGTSFAPIEHRPGENIRCMDYCDVADFCPFGRALKKAQLVKFKEPSTDEEGPEESNETSEEAS